jgi:HNH endonuclease
MKDQALYDKLVAHIRKDDATGCWLWTGPARKTPHPGNRYGYVTIKRKGKWTATNAHRAMMFAIHGELTKEQCACHKCDVPLCINPDHLFIGTMKDNIWDSRRKGRHYESRKEFCDRGHPLFGENVRLFKQGAGKGPALKRTCKTCQRERQRQRYLMNPELHNARNRMYRERKKAREVGSSHSAEGKSGG